MMRLCLIAVCFLLPSLGAAQDSVFVRAGEHPTYSRLVIQIAADRPWEFRTSGRRAVLSLPDAAVDFDIGEVFDRIPKTRILSLRSVRSGQNSDLVMTFGCACEAVAKIESNMLIIDVREDDASRAGLDAPPEREEMTAELPPPRPAAPSRIDDFSTEEPDMAGLDPSSLESPPPPDEDTSDPPSLDTPGPVAAENVAQRLMDQLNRAAEQGLVELVEPRSQPEPAPPPQVEPPEPENFLDTVEEDIDGLDAMADRISRQLEQADIGGSVTVRIPETISQLAKPGQLPEMPHQPAEKVASNDHCIDPELIDVRYWADERPPAVQISDLRGKVFGEFDEPDMNTALELVRLYLAHGFGLEANALIVDLNLIGYEAEILAELAGVMEGHPHVAGGHLDKAAGCGGNNDLWRAASIGTTEDLPIPDPEEVIAYYAETPILIRRLLAPKLIEGFLVRGQVSEARSLIEILDRSPGRTSDAIKLARARLWHNEGQIQEAEAAYAQLLQTGGAEAVEAAILLTESILSRGAKIPALLVQDLEGLAQIYRGTDLGRRLRLSEISAKAGSDRLDAALAIVQDEFGTSILPGSDIAAATDNILKDASVARYGEEQLLASIFKFRDIVSNAAISAEARSHLARELHSSGLPNAALSVLATDAEDPSDDHALITARAEVSLDRPERAHEKLADLTSVDAAILRADALTIQGRFSAAYATLEMAGVSDEIDEFAWRAGDWAVAARSEKDAIRNLAEFMALRETPPRPSNDVLEDIGLDEDSLSVAQVAPNENDTITLDYVRDTQARSESMRAFLETAISSF